MSLCGTVVLANLLCGDVDKDELYIRFLPTLCTKESEDKMLGLPASITALTPSQ